MKLKYPAARRDDSVVDDYHGTKVPDPYRWMEDPDAEETKKFVDAQNEVAVPFLEKCPARKQINSRITEMWDYGKYSCPTKHGDKFYYYYNTGLQNQRVLYVQDTLESEASIFLDPNALSADGTVAIYGTQFSEDGSLFAYSLSDAGSDWVSIKFKEASTKKDLPDVLKRCKFTSMAWTHDNKGLFYNSYAEGKSEGTETVSNVHQKLYYHRLGTEQSEDVLCAEWPDNPKWMTGVEVSDCGRYLIMELREGCKPMNKLYYTDLQSLEDGIKGILPFVKVVDNFDAEYEYLTNEGSLFTFKTNLKAPKYKIINIDLEKPDMEHWTVLVEEDTKDVLEWASVVNKDKLVLCYLHDVKNQLHIHELSTGARKASLPLDIGSIVGFSGKKKHTQIFYQFMSFLSPGIIFRCDLTTDSYEPKVFREIKVKNFDPSPFKQTQVFYPSKDGTKIPMFIIHKKDLELNGSQPVYLYGYGGFSISITPTFSVSRLVFMNNLGGVVAIPNIRGGAEYGETWHDGGTHGNKQNVFDDFVAAAEYLIQHKYTSPEKIILNGGSNGGLLVVACANQRPELFGAIVSQVGVLDILRFHKFTIGHAWTTDFGCSDIPDNFEYIYNYSPLHNVAIPEGESQYPAMLLLTGDHDDRVVPAHSLKYIAEIQHKMGDVAKQTNPLLARIDTKSGHGAGKPTAKRIEEITDIFSFIYETIGLQWKE